MPQPPDYIVSLYDKTTTRKGVAGAAWCDTSTGAISIVLNLGVVIPNDPNVLIKLFPNTKEQERPQAPSRPKTEPYKPKPKPPHDPDLDSNYDIPF